uniref:Tetratricopeptide repeat protein 39B n=1 Tax=Plectus sambesii TaxID=2011161 RepID=A0A914X4X1_9BILA
TYAYMTAIFMHAQYDTLGVADRGYMTSLCEKVPSLRIRIAGKSIPVEKFCGMKARRYSLKGTLTLAHYELIYLWNGFNILGQKEELLKPILADIEAQIKRIESAQVRDQDDYCLCLLLKAMCFKHLQSPFQAEQCFKDIIDSESRLTDHRYLVPSSYFELALLRMDEDRLTETQQLLTKAREFKNYPLETRLHFRIHSAFEKLGVKTPSPTRL